MNTETRIKAYSAIMPIHTRRIDAMTDLGFFEAPASISFHGAYGGGLFDHSLEVTKTLVELTERLGLAWSRPESPYIVGMYHDLCKCDNYIRDPFNPDAWIYNRDPIIPGHGDKSVIMLARLMTMTDEEIACIRWHMGAYEKDSTMWDYYGRAIEKFPNVLYTHMADMIASKIIGI